MNDLTDFRGAWSHKTAAKTREAVGVARDRNTARLERIVD